MYKCDIFANRHNNATVLLRHDKLKNNKIKVCQAFVRKLMILACAKESSQVQSHKRKYTTDKLSNKLIHTL